jgi:hypothetical protein
LHLLLLGYETHNWCEMKSKSKSKPQPFFSKIMELG